ncbi:hypothetical protein [Kribbella sp. NPDC006257]|uniref:hypothetical protein n=1 Tax=Kribbella sp. NPDC006257 TaxID=3156738 RepID=UPI0033A766FA
MGSHELVAADRARQLIGVALQPVVADFEHVRGLRWAKPLSPGIRAVVDVRSLKGAQFDITYGVCCDWVPHRQGDTYRWHRTLKQTRLDLWVDHFTVDAEPRQWISTLDGERKLQRQAAKAVRQVAKQAVAWWATVGSETGVLSEAYRQASNAFELHEPAARFVAAFTQARLGDLPAAQRELALGNYRSSDLNQRLAELSATHPT